MKPSSFIAFVGLTATVLVAAVLTVQNHTAITPGTDSASQPLIPNLAQQINKITVITLTSGKQTLTLSRADPDSADWTITEKFGYHADTNLIKRAIVALAGAKTIEPRTDNPTNYVKLSLADDTATTITVRGADRTGLPGIAIGKAGPGAAPDHQNTFYARRLNEPQAWLAEGRLPPLSVDPMQWISRDLPSLLQNQVASVTIARPNSPNIVISRPSAEITNFTLSGAPRDSKPKQDKINDLAGVVAFLIFEDVAPINASEKPNMIMTVRSFEGEILTVRVSNLLGQSWASIGFSLDTGNKSPEAQSRLKNQQARYGNWSYRLPDRIAKDLTPTIDDLAEVKKADDRSTTNNEPQKAKRGR